MQLSGFCLDMGPIKMNTQCSHPRLKTGPSSKSRLVQGPERSLVLDGTSICFACMGALLAWDHGSLLWLISLWTERTSVCLHVSFVWAISQCKVYETWTYQWFYFPTLSLSSHFPLHNKQTPEMIAKRVTIVLLASLFPSHSSMSLSHPTNEYTLI